MNRLDIIEYTVRCDSDGDRDLFCAWCGKKLMHFNIDTVRDFNKAKSAVEDHWKESSECRIKLTK